MKRNYLIQSGSSTFGREKSHPGSYLLKETFGNELDFKEMFNGPFSPTSPIAPLTLEDMFIEESTFRNLSFYPSLEKEFDPSVLIDLSSLEPISFEQPLDNIREYVQNDGGTCVNDGSNQKRASKRSLVVTTTVMPPRKKAKLCATDYFSLSLYDTLRLFHERRQQWNRRLGEFLTGQAKSKIGTGLIENSRVGFVVRPSTKRGTLERVFKTKILTLRLNIHKQKNYCVERMEIAGFYFRKQFVIRNEYYISWISSNEALVLSDGDRKNGTSLRNLEVRVVDMKHGEMKKNHRCNGNEAVILVKKIRQDKRKGSHQEHITILMPNIGESKLLYVITVRTVVKDTLGDGIHVPEKIYESKFVFRKNGNKTGRFAEKFNERIDKVDYPTYEISE